ncbi:ATP synthase F1 subunit epsilon [Petrotoga sp. 9PWA.NaAc.5.4]|uniref:ATP synthase F1 subunit epsilon n=1 Tax=Petrotoga sp. 9PWA.NaAc.5.4 TaxID=1434328 RepID=UPI001E5BA926|nr:ATP synthase F1 subunit epsilon [Petrotoga sp. 9PWA.NaAc.5.4]
MILIFKLKIVTPEGTRFEDEVEYVELATKEGYMGSLTNRLPFVGMLRIAPLTIKIGNRNEVFAVHGGIVEMNGVEMIVVTTAAEKAEDIDIEAAKRAIERAQEELKASEDNFKKIKLQTRIEKNLLRMNVSKNR